MFKKIIAFTLSILLLLTTSFSSFFVGDSFEVYGYGEDITRSMANFLFPIVSYVAGEQLLANGAYDSIQLSAQNIADIIDDLITMKTSLLNTIPVTSKILFTKIQTDLSDYEINKMYGTTFSKDEMLQFDTQALSIKTKITNNEPLTNSDLYGLGIHSILVNYMKSKYNSSSSVLNDTNDLILTTISGFEYAQLNFGKYSVRSKTKQYDNSDFIQFINGLYKYSAISGSFQEYNPYYLFYLNISSRLNLSSNYYLSINKTANYSFRCSNSDNSNVLYMTNTNFFEYDFFIKKNSDNTIVKFLNVTKSTPLLTILNFIKVYTTSDIVNSDYYINSQNYNFFDLFNLGRLGTVTYTPKKLYIGQNSISGLSSKVIESTNSPDTSLGQAEKIIANKDVNVTYDNDVQAVPNQNTGDEDIVITPTDTTIPATSSSSTNTADPDTGAVIGDGVFNIPILGTMLKALWDILNLLKGLLEALKNLFVSLFVPSVTFLQNYFSRISTFLGDRLGLLYYPIELLIDFINRYMNIPDTGSIVIDVPALVITSLGKQYTLFPAYRFDFNSVFGLSAFLNIRTIYLVSVDVIVIFGLVYLLQKKFREVFHL